MTLQQLHDDARALLARGVAPDTRVIVTPRSGDCVVPAGWPATDVELWTASDDAAQEVAVFF